MSLRTQDRLRDRGTIDARDETLKRAYETGEYIDGFTTVEPEPWQVTLARLPKCMQKKEIK